MKYRLKQGKHTRFENGIAARYVPGDVFEPTEAELVSIKDRIEPVEEWAEGGPVDGGNLYLVGEGQGDIFIPTVGSNGVTPGDGAVVVNLVLPNGGEIPRDPTPYIPDELNGLLDDKTIQSLEAAGVLSLDDLATIAAETKKLEGIAGISREKAKKIRQLIAEMKIPSEERPSEAEDASQGDA